MTKISKCSKTNYVMHPLFKYTQRALDGMFRGELRSPPPQPYKKKRIGLSGPVNGFLRINVNKYIRNSYGPRAITVPEIQGLKISLLVKIANILKY